MRQPELLPRGDYLLRQKPTVIIMDIMGKVIPAETMDIMGRAIPAETMDAIRIRE